MGQRLVRSKGLVALTSALRLAAILDRAQPTRRNRCLRSRKEEFPADPWFSDWCRHCLINQPMPKPIDLEHSMLNRHLINHEHTSRFLVTSDTDGWEVREEQDAAVVRVVHRADWHRVERDRLLFDLRARALAYTGWIDD